jgi:nucleotide-binding universal stress UspA family protein
MFTNPLPQPVVVGVHDGPTSRVALDWAIDEATTHKLPLRILHAGPPSPASRFDIPAAGERVRIPAVVARAVRRARSLTPWLEVTTEVSTSEPSAALVDASHWAACVIVGAHGRRPVVSGLLGSTSVEVAANAACPVVVVRQLPEVEPWRPGVVVGADGSEVSTEVLSYAFEQAADRELPLKVVQVWPPGATRAFLAPALKAALTTLAAREQALVAEEVARFAEKYPDVRVNRHLLRAHPVKALVAHSRGAELLVVGCRERAESPGVVLGSVNQGVLQHAHCPVAVVRSRAS